MTPQPERKHNGGIRINPDAAVKEETLELDYCLKFVTQPSLEDVELYLTQKIVLGLHREHVSGTARGTKNVGLRRFPVSKVAIQIGEVQKPMLSQAIVEAASGCPSTVDIPRSACLESSMFRIVRRKLPYDPLVDSRIRPCAHHTAGAEYEEPAP